MSLDLPAPTKTTSSPDWAAFSISGGTSGKGLKVRAIDISFYRDGTVCNFLDSDLLTQEFILLPQAGQFSAYGDKTTQ